MNVTCRAIGVISSPWRVQQGTPIQPLYAEDSFGMIEVYPEFADGLADLEGFERIWLLTWLHKSGPAKLRVIPYRDTVERGVFATRSPARPNPIALSCVRLERVDGNLLHIAGCDLLDGTPVLDIKPYSPDIDSFPGSKAGWWDAGNARTKADDRFSS